MQYRSLGRCGLKVSEIAIGSWMTAFASPSEARTAQETLLMAYESGVNLFDCADVYGGGGTERFLGEVLAQFDRSSYVVTSKVFFPSGDGPNDRGLSRKHIRHQIDASLRNLSVDYIDLYFCHRFDPSVPLDETLRVMSDLVDAGKILYYGVSEWSAVQILQAQRVIAEHRLHPLSAVQPQYNLFDRHIEKDILPVCDKEGVGVLPFSPLAQGLLAGKYELDKPFPEGSRATQLGGGQVNDLLTRANLESVARLQAVARDLGLDVAVLAIAWLLRNPIVSAVIAGASRPAQLQTNLEASGVVLPVSALEEIDAILDYSPTSRSVG